MMRMIGRGDARDARTGDFTGPQRHRRLGFTLVELLVAVGILAVIMAIATPIYLNQRTAAWKSTVVSDVNGTAASVERISDSKTPGGDDKDTTIVPYASNASDSGVRARVESAVDASDAGTGASGVMAAASTATSVFNHTYDASNGRLARTAEYIDGYVDTAVVSAGNTVNVQMRSDGSYTITGSNRNVKNWVYTYDSGTGTGKWSGGTVPAGDDTPLPQPSPSNPGIGECAISYNTATGVLDVGADGGHCVVSVDHSADWEDMKTVNLHGWVTFSGSGTVFMSKKAEDEVYKQSLTSIPYLSGQKVDFSKGYSAAGMFFDMTHLADAPSLEHWDTSNITDMSQMFAEDYKFNQNISGWNTAAVTDMSGMFNNDSVFNQNIGNWNTANVVDMSSMFGGTDDFNQPIGGWNTAKVADMHDMFFLAGAFNQPIAAWNVGSVRSMNQMFEDSVYNQPLSGWNTAKVTDMAMMFDSSDFNQDISGWNTAVVTDMSNMFAYSAFNHPLNAWNVSQVKDMSYMFSGSSVFNQPLSSWKTTAVTDMSYMFMNATAFAQSLNGWDVSHVTDMSYMFSDATSFNQSISSWNTSAVTTMKRMFDSSAFNQPISGWSTGNVTDMSGMFFSDSFNQNIGGWNVAKVKDMSDMFEHNSVFNQNIGGWNTGSVTNMSSMFYDAVFNQNLSSWNVAKVTSHSQFSSYQIPDASLPKWVS